MNYGIMSYDILSILIDCLGLYFFRCRLVIFLAIFAFGFCYLRAILKLWFECLIFVPIFR